jgi:chromosome segregation ATPase
MDTITPADIQRAPTIQSVFSALSAVLATAATAVVLWRGVRREPPVDKDLEDIRAELLKRPTHTDCTAKHQRITDAAKQLNDASQELNEAGHKSIGDELQHNRDLLDHGTKQFLQIERTLGRLEATQDAQATRITEIQAELREIRASHNEQTHPIRSIRRRSHGP